MKENILANTFITKVSFKYIEHENIDKLFIKFFAVKIKVKNW